LEALQSADARAVIVGFGDYRGELEAAAPPGTLFTGALEHRHLVHLLPLADVAVVPSIFPEAFGMVAAEAAAAGCPPLVARHSGLEEVARGLEAEYPERHAGLASFATGDVDDLRAKLRALLALPPAERRELGAAARSHDFEVVSFRLLRPRRLAPRIVVRTTHYLELAHATRGILRRLDPKAATGDDRTGWRYEGFYFEADDEHGVPFLVVFNFLRGPHAGGGQWARSDPLFPFAHG